jgi:hypothetical protein
MPIPSRRPDPERRRVRRRHLRPARAPRSHRRTAPPGGVAGRDVHLVLGDLLHLVAGLAGDRDVLPLLLRAAVPGRGRLPGAAEVRPPATGDRSAGADRRHLLRRRPDVLAPRHRVRGCRARNRPRQPPGPGRRAGGLGGDGRAAPAVRAARPADRPRRRRADQRDRWDRSVRVGPGHRRGPGAPHGDLLRGLPVDHPAGRPGPAASGGPGRGRDGLDRGLRRAGGPLARST